MPTDNGRAASADPDDRAMLIPARLSEIKTCSTLFDLPRDERRIEQLHKHTCEVQTTNDD